MGVAERFSGGLKPHDNGGSIPSSHTKRMRVRTPLGSDRVIGNKHRFESYCIHKRCSKRRSSKCVEVD